MPKEGIKIDDMHDILRSMHGNSRWSLCIGAGSSRPLFPEWYSLVNIMIQNVLKTHPEIQIDIDKLKNLGFSADAIIQALKNMLDISENDFIQLMSNSLYQDFIKKVTPTTWKKFVRVLGTYNPNDFKDSEWKEFICVRDSYLTTSSANQLAQCIVKARESGLAPDTILSFNAEPLLLTLINSYLREPYIGKIRSTGDIPVVCDKITSSVDTSYTNHTSYIHCHGILPIPGIGKKHITPANKLVFAENSYLQLSNSAFSWQSSSFISTCMTQRVVFVGVSLTDPNMRKWLSWIHQNRLEEYTQSGFSAQNSTQHYWIKTIPKTPQEKLWFESVVSHLGVRIVWINNWGEVGTVLSKMLGL